jgi:hypothetical protein
VPVLAIAAHIPSAEIGADYFQCLWPGWLRWVGPGWTNWIEAAHAQGTDPVAFRALFDATGCPILPSVRYAENRSLAFCAAHGIRPRARVAEFEEARSDNYKLICHEGNLTQAIEFSWRNGLMPRRRQMAAGLIRAPHGFAYFRCHRPAF